MSFSLGGRYLCCTKWYRGWFYCGPASLQSALDTANSTNGDHILFLQQGTYNAAAVSGFKITVVNNATEKSITLSGGWTAGYTAQNTDPETTKLNGGDTFRVLNLLADGGTAYINFHVENVTIENGYVLGGVEPGFRLTYQVPTES